MKTILNFTVVFLLLVLSSGILINNANAQTVCPQGKSCAVFIWVNGIAVKNSADWDTTVNDVRTKFFNANSDIDQAYIKFDPAYNQSFGMLKDIFGQSIFQWDQQFTDSFLANSSVLQNSSVNNILLAYALWNYSFDAKRFTTDLIAIGDKIHSWQNLGYRVVLVGHSQGSFLTNEAYTVRIREAVADKSIALPDANLLSVVNIASSANNVADGRNKYTTQCNDIILVVPKVLPGNVNDPTAPCTPFLMPPPPVSILAGVLDAIAATVDIAKLWHGYNVHQLSTYTADKSATQKQIFAHLVDSLPDPGCAGNENCYLHDTYSPTLNYKDNWIVTKKSGNSLEPLRASGCLTLSSLSGFPTFLDPGQITLRTRRVFTGLFWGSLRFRSRGAGKSIVSFKKASDDSVAASITADSTKDFGENWRQMFFGWKDDNLTISSLGPLPVKTAFNQAEGYYLELDSQGDNTLEVKDLDVSRVRNTELSDPTLPPPAPSPPTPSSPSPPPSPPPPPPVPLTGSCSLNGGQNPVTMQVSGTAYFNASFSGGTGAIHFSWTGATGGDASSASQVYNTSGTYTASVKLTDSGSPQQQVIATCPQVTVSNPAPPPPVALSYVCSISPPTIKLGSSASFAVSVYGGYPPYTFYMPGAVFYRAPNTQISTIPPPLSVGVQTYSGFVQDSQGKVTYPTCSVTVTN